MENRINVAELLKDCPSGMELDCTMFENVTFVRVDMGRKQFPIEIAVGGIRSKYLTKEGCFHDTTLLPESKCVIFPKGKTTWEGFVPQCKFKDGDIVYFITENNNEYITIFKNDGNVYLETYVDVSIATSRYSLDVSFYIDNIKEQRLATAEEKQKLFLVIEDNGYKWNPDNKTLEKLPKFKVGDRIILKYNPHNIPSIRIKEVTKTQYILENGEFFYIKNSTEEKYVLEDKFDITTLVPFKSEVLVRNDEHQYWIPAFWGFKRKNDYTTTFGWCRYCIPYKGNEHLLGTTDDCEERFKTWK